MRSNSLIALLAALCLTASASPTFAAIVDQTPNNGESPPVSMACKGNKSASGTGFKLSIDRLEGPTRAIFSPIPKNSTGGVALKFPFRKTVIAKRLEFTTVTLAPDRTMSKGAVFAYFDVRDGNKSRMSVIGHIQDHMLTDFWVSRQLGESEFEFDCALLPMQTLRAAT